MKGASVFFFLCLNACSGAPPPQEAAPPSPPPSTSPLAEPGRTELPPRPKTPLQKKVFSVLARAEAQLKKFQKADPEQGEPECRSGELDGEMGALWSESITSGDLGSSLALERMTVRLIECEDGFGHERSRSKRLSLSIRLAMEGRHFEAAELYELDRKWLTNHGLRQSKEMAQLVALRAQSLSWGGASSAAYRLLEQQRPLLRRHAVDELLRVLNSLGLYSCLNGRLSLALSYANEARQVHRLVKDAQWQQLTTAQIGACLRDAGKRREGEAIVRWAADIQLRRWNAQKTRDGGNPQEEWLEQRLLASLYVLTGDHQRAMPIYEDLVARLSPSSRILRVTDDGYGAYIYAVVDLSRSSLALGDLEGARRWIERAPADVITADFSAKVYRGLGKSKKAHDILRIALRKTKGWGPRYRMLLLAEQGRTFWSEGKIGDATKSFKASFAQVLEYIEQRGRMGSQADRRRALTVARPVVDSLIAMNVRDAPRNVELSRFALSAAVYLRTELLTSTTSDVSALRRSGDPHDQELLEKLAQARSALSRAATLARDGAQAALLEERRTLEDLEAQMRERSVAFSLREERVTAKALAKALKPGTAFIYYLQYASDAPDAFAQEPERRFAAYVLNSRAKIDAIDLGAAATIDKEVGELRKTLKPGGAGFLQASLRLRRSVIEPLSRPLSFKKELLLSPAGSLHLIPFATLADSKKRLLIEDYSLSYVASPGELLTSPPTDLPSYPGVIAAGPAFDKGRVGPSSPFSLASRGQIRVDLKDKNWEPLRGTVREGKRLAKIFPSALLLTGDEVTEAALKAVRGPRILHIATHGYFLEQGRYGSPSRGVSENPLLLSGLVLSGANFGGTGDDDGYFSALEMSSLNLWGTEVATLSACDTGLGEVDRDEGVQGMRRALSLAGSRSQLLSLWDVDDLATEELMAQFYQGIAAGEGRAAALRRIQLSFLRGSWNLSGAQKGGSNTKSRKYSSPYYWAAFVLSGDRGPLRAR